MTDNPLEVKSLMELDQEPHSLDRFMKWLRDFDDYTETTRIEQEKDWDYYDGFQWDAEIAEKLQRRGQAPVVFNRIKKHVNTFLGEEIKGRTDPTALPRTPVHLDESSAIGDAIRYVFDREKFQRITSAVAKNVVVPGYGGCILGTEIVKKKQRIDESSNVRPIRDGVAVDELDKEVEITMTPVAYDRMFYDPHSASPLMEDALYVGVLTWMYLDEAQEKYPEAAEELASVMRTASDAGTDTFDDKPRNMVDRKENRVLAVEVYYEFEGNCWTAHFTEGLMLRESRPTGFMDRDGRHECPFIPVSGYIDRDNNRYGMVRPLRDPQDQVNKTHSKFMHLITMRQIMYERSAVEDPWKMSQELTKPDGKIELRDGALSSGRVQLLQTADMAQAHFQMLQEAKSELDELGTDLSSLVNQTDASGRALQVGSSLRSLETAQLRDNIDAFKLKVAQRVFNMIVQFWTDEKWIRVRDSDDREGLRFVGLNKPMTKGDRIQEIIEGGATIAVALNVVGEPELAQQVMQAIQNDPELQQLPPEQINQVILQQIAQLPMLQEMIKKNDVANLDVDIVLDESPDTAILAHETFEKLVSLQQSGMQIPPEIILEAAPLPNKKKLLERLKSDGQAQQQQQQQIAQMQEQQQQMQAALIQAGIMKTQAEVEKIQADAQRSIATGNKDMTQAALNIEELNLAPAKEAKMMAEIALSGPKGREADANALDEQTRAVAQDIKNRQDLGQLPRPPKED